MIIVDPEIRVGVNEIDPSHDLSLNAGHKAYGLMLSKKWRGLQQAPRTPTTVLLKGGKGGQWGDHDPDFAHIQQSTWIGGMMQNEFSDDPTRYFHGINAFTMVPGRLIPTFRYVFADGDYRDYNRHDMGNFDWIAAYGDNQYIATSFVASAQDSVNYAADKCYFWVRRFGRPGDLTAQIFSDADSAPSSGQGNNVGVGVATIQDSPAQWVKFDWSGTTTLTDGTTYWIVITAATPSDAQNHWEIGVDPDGSASKVSSGGVSWSSAAFTMYYRVVDADTAVKWHFFMLGATLYKVSQPASGTSELFVWDETNDEWDAVTIKAGDDALAGIVVDVTVRKGYAHMARGTGNTIWVFYKTGSYYRGATDATGGNTADLVWADYDPVDGSQIWRAENATHVVSRANIQTFDTDLVFGDDIQMPEGVDMLCLRGYNDIVWIRTVDGVWYIDKSDKPAQLGVGLDAIFETEGFAPLLAKDLFLMIGWDYTLERLYGSTLDDIGPWRGAGLPEDYQGRVSALCSGIGMTFVAIDGGSGNYSSVLAYDGQNYHPIFNGPEKGQRIRNVFWQPVSGAGGRLWISYGGDSIFMQFPEKTLNPLHDTSMNYHHEAVVETSTFTMDAERLKKFFKKLDFITERLGNLGDIAVDYKIDEDIGDSTATWSDATTLITSPLGEVPLHLGNKHRIRFRYRIRTLDADKPATVIATILDCFARTPYKRVWTLQIDLGGKTKSGDADHNAYDLYEWLEKMCQNAIGVTMRANDHMMDGVVVLVEPPSLLRKAVQWLERKFTGRASFILREV